MDILDILNPAGEHTAIALGLAVLAGVMVGVSWATKAILQDKRVAAWLKRLKADAMRQLRGL